MSWQRIAASTPPTRPNNRQATDGHGGKDSPRQGGQEGCRWFQGGTAGPGRPRLSDGQARARYPHGRSQGPRKGPGLDPTRSVSVIAAYYRPEHYRPGWPQAVPGRNRRAGSPTVSQWTGSMPDTDMEGRRATEGPRPRPDPQRGSDRGVLSARALSARMAASGSRKEPPGRKPDDEPTDRLDARHRHGRTQGPRKGSGNPPDGVTRRVTPYIASRPDRDLTRNSRPPLRPTHDAKGDGGNGVGHSSEHHQQLQPGGTAMNTY